MTICDRRHPLRVGLLAAPLLFCITGCGAPGAGRHPGHTQDSARQLPAGGAPALSFRFLGADPGDPELPERAADLRSRRPTDEFVAKDGLLVFTHLIPLASDSPGDSGARFLVWPEAWPEVVNSPRIIEASFALRLRDLQETERGEPDRELASFDSQTRRWFVPILKRVRAEEVNPGETYLLILDLTLEGGTKVTRLLNLRFLGALPRVKLERLAHASLLPEPPAAGRALLSAGEYSVREEFIAPGPGRRDLAVWIRAEPWAGRMRTLLAAKEWFSTGQGPVGTHPLFRQSEVALRLTAVRANGHRYELGAGQWVRLPVPSKRGLKLEWLVTPAGPTCGLPGAIVQDFNWDEQIRGYRGEDSLRHRFQRTVEPWRVAAVRMQGALKRELVLTDPYVRDLPEDHQIQDQGRLADGDYRRIQASTEEPFRELTGDDFPDSPQVAGCQGIYL